MSKVLFSVKELRMEKKERRKKERETERREERVERKEEIKKEGGNGEGRERKSNGDVGRLGLG